MKLRKSRHDTEEKEFNIETADEYSIKDRKTVKSQAYKRAIIAIVVLALLMFGAGMKYARYLEGKPLADVALAGGITQTESFDAAVATTDLVVMVKGCADKTGYFSVSADTSLRELMDYIEVTADGDVSDFDFNHKMQTGDVYYIKSKNNPVDITPWLSNEQTEIAASDEEDTAAGGEKINLNTATAEQLQKLDGIGETKSKAIIDYREKHGGFKRIEDVLAVKGIGDKTYAGFKDKITVE